MSLSLLLLLLLLTWFERFFRRFGEHFRLSCWTERHRDCHNFRRARNLLAGSVRVEDRRPSGEIRRQRHRKCNRFQLGECLLGPRAAMVHCRRLLAGEGHSIRGEKNSKTRRSRRWHHRSLSNTIRRQVALRCAASRRRRFGA